MAEGGGLLNRYTLQRRIEGSNPSVSARFRASESLLVAGLRGARNLTGPADPRALLTTIVSTLPTPAE